MKYSRIVRISVARTNHDSLILLDTARRQMDLLGAVGIKAKKGQTNARYRAKGYLRFEFPTKSLRRKYVSRVKEFCDAQIKMAFFRKKIRP